MTACSQRQKLEVSAENPPVKIPTLISIMPHLHYDLAF